MSLLDLNLVTTRTSASQMSSFAFLDAGVYKCRLVYTITSNQAALAEQFVEFVKRFAKTNNGALEATLLTGFNDNELTFKRTDIFAFLNRESCVCFASEVGYQKECKTQYFDVDFDSIRALYP